MTREELRGCLAVKTAKEARVSPRDLNETAFPPASQPPPHSATGKDLNTLKVWQARLGDEEERTYTEGGSSNATDAVDTPATSLDVPSASHGGTVLSPVPSERPLQAIGPQRLNTDTRGEHDAVAWHLYHTLRGHATPPLRMVANGEGGVGNLKKAIRSITELFCERNAPHLLREEAYKGAGAYPIQGRTCHYSAAVSRQERSPSCAEKLQSFWPDVLYGIMDEYSLLGKFFIARIFVNPAIGRCASDDSCRSFSDLNDALFNDPHQLPPIGCSIHEDLFFPTDGQRDSTMCQVGREVYLEFTMAVTAKQQVRARWLAGGHRRSHSSRRLGGWQHFHRTRHMCHGGEPCSQLSCDSTSLPFLRMKNAPTFLFFEATPETPVKPIRRIHFPTKDGEIIYDLKYIIYLGGAHLSARFFADGFLWNYGGRTNNGMPYLEDADYADLSDFSGRVPQGFLYKQSRKHSSAQVR